MKCYYHRELDAIGSCKHCCKGLCPGCAVDVGGGLACAGSCVAAVTQINALINANATATSMNKGPAAYFWPLFLIVLGAVFAAEPLLTGRPANAQALGAALGAVFVLFGIVLGLYQRAWRKRLQKPA